MPELLHPGVYVLEVPPAVRPIAGVSTSTAAFIGATGKGSLPGTILPNGSMAQPVMVTSFTDYQRQFGGYRLDSFLTYAVQAFFANGGQRLYIVRVAGAGTAASTAGAAPFGLSAANQGKWGDSITVAIANSSDANANNFKLTVSYGGVLVESFDGLTFWSGNASDPIPANYARTVINSRSAYIAITGDITSRPANTPTNTPITFSNGNDGAALTSAEYIGAPAADNTVTGTGLYALDKITDVNLIAIPGQGDPATVNAGMDYCKNQRQLQDCFFIGDVGTVDVVGARMVGAVTDVSKLSDAQAYATTGFGGTPLDLSAGDYGAIYYPWVLATDPIGTGRNPVILLPPSGFMAGIYARIDNSRGVFKAPAGTEAGVAGALATATNVSDVEQDLLNPINVDVIRTVPGSGIVVWGARTIGSDPGWRYIPVRRMAIFLRVSIYYGIQWAVFEPNDEPLWASLRLNIRAFMLTQFRAGAFQGSKPDDAFFVLCDSTTTTQQDIDNGVVNILVGFAPLKPAEFVVLKLSQKVNQSAS
jgi:phage tail sheath protein FI